MDPAVIAAAVAAVQKPARCPAPVRVARIHLVDGMPFVVAIRPTLRARTRADGTRAGAHAFVLYDGQRPLATVHFVAGGSVVVNGYVAPVAGGTAVDVEAPPAGCASKTAQIVINPS
jgi:hypothetical protein